MAVWSPSWKGRTCPTMPAATSACGACPRTPCDPAARPSAGDRTPGRCRRRKWRDPDAQRARQRPLAPAEWCGPTGCFGLRCFDPVAHVRLLDAERRPLRVSESDVAPSEVTLPRTTTGPHGGGPDASMYETRNPWSVARLSVRASLLEERLAVEVLRCPLYVLFGLLEEVVVVGHHSAVL